jgi:hypothetical protein
MATDNILYVSSASIAVGTITDASGVGLVPSASHALFSDTAGTVETANTASYVAGSNVDGAVALATSASHALVADTALSYMEQPKFKSGKVAGGDFAGNPKTYTVTFATPFDDGDYSVMLNGGNARAWTAETLVSGSFIISANSNVAMDEDVYWLAMEHGESD